VTHLIVPFAAVVSEAGRHAASTLALPHLERLLSRCAAGATFGDDERSLSTPHELALADALGWPAEDGLVPWAAARARDDGVTVGDRPWGLLTPVHLRLGTEQVSMTDPADLQLDEASSRALFEIVRPLFESEGFVLQWGAPLRWYASHDSLAVLPTASLDRVIGRHVDAWLPEVSAVRLVRRLQSEVQMLLHDHAFNAERDAAGLPAVNSFWLSDCGAAMPARHERPTPTVDGRLRRAALAEDWATWCDAWQALDAGPIAALVQAPAGATLTLAGERRSASFTRAATPWWQRWRRVSASNLLESL